MLVFASEQTPPARAGNFKLGALNVSTSKLGGRLWTVNLASWLRQRPEKALGSCRVELVLTGGGDSASAADVVQLDYPAAGTVFSVHARTLVMSFVGSVTSSDLAGQRPPPKLGAWVVEGGASNRSMGATLTDPDFPFILGAGGTQPHAIPVRARSYRLLVVSGLVFRIDQQNQNATPTTQSTDNFLVATDGSPASRSQWFPIAPDVVTLLVQNLDLTASEYRIQYLLEMG